MLHKSRYSPNSGNSWAQARRRLALAVHNESAIASDDQKAFRQEASARLGPSRILTTRGLYAVAVRAGVLSGDVAEAEMQTIASLRASARILW